MKRLAALACLMLLASCILVDNLGEFWDKGVVDKLLIGKWKMQRDNSIMVISASRTMYRVTSLDENCTNGGTEECRTASGKTLKAGRYMFYMQQAENGTGGYLYRYKVDDNKITFYSLNSVPARTFISMHQPGYMNLYVDERTTVPGTHIRQLDRDAVKILSQIPDSDIYWRADNIYERTK